MDDRDPNARPSPRHYKFCKYCNRWHMAGVSYVCGADEMYEATFPVYGTVRWQGEPPKTVKTDVGQVEFSVISELLGIRKWVKSETYGWKLE